MKWKRNSMCLTCNKSPECNKPCKDIENMFIAIGLEKELLEKVCNEVQ